MLIEDTDLERGKLPKPSRVKVAKPVTLGPSIVRARVGRLKAGTMARVMREFESLFA